LTKARWTGNPPHLPARPREVRDHGLITDKVTDLKSWADRGSRSLARFRDPTFAGSRDSRTAASWRASAPKPNLYVLPLAEAAPVISPGKPGRRVTDLLPQPNGDLYATLVYAGTSGGVAHQPPKPAADSNPRRPRTPLPPQKESSSWRAPRKNSPAAARSSGFPPADFPRPSSPAAASRSTAAAPGSTLLIAAATAADVLGSTC